MKSLICCLCISSACIGSHAAGSALQVDFGAYPSNESANDWLNISTQKTSQSSGQQNNYATFQISLNNATLADTVTLGTLGDASVTLSMKWKSTASAANASGAYDTTNTGTPRNDLFPSSVVQKGIDVRCNGVKPQSPGIQFTLDGLTADTQYYLYVLANNGQHTNKTTMSLTTGENGTSNITAQLLTGYENVGTISGNTFTGTDTQSSGVGIEYIFTTDSTGNVTLTFERPIATTEDTVYQNVALNAFILSTMPIPEPATATLALLSLGGLCVRRRMA